MSEKKECEIKEKFELVSKIMKENGASFNLKMNCLACKETFQESYKGPDEPKETTESPKVIPKPKIVTLDDFLGGH